MRKRGSDFWSVQFDRSSTSRRFRRSLTLSLRDLVERRIFQAVRAAGIKTPLAGRLVALRVKGEDGEERGRGEGQEEAVSGRTSGHRIRPSGAGCPEPAASRPVTPYQGPDSPSSAPDECGSTFKREHACDNGAIRRTACATRQAADVQGRLRAEACREEPARHAQAVISVRSDPCRPSVRPSRTTP